MLVAGSPCRRPWRRRTGLRGSGHPAGVQLPALATVIGLLPRCHAP